MQKNRSHAKKHIQLKRQTKHIINTARLNIIENIYKDILNRIEKFVEFGNTQIK